jgi:hypothetical protein
VQAHLRGPHCQRRPLAQVILEGRLGVRGFLLCRRLRSQQLLPLAQQLLALPELALVEGGLHGRGLLDLRMHSLRDYASALQRLLGWDCVVRMQLVGEIARGDART